MAAKSALHGSLITEKNINRRRRSIRMLRKIIAPFLMLLLAALSGCVAEEKEEKPAAASPTPVATIVYGKGFFDEEKAGANSWRWMEPTGSAKLRNTGKDMELTVAGRPPVEHFKQPPTITITLNGTKLDEFKGANDVVQKTYTITPAQKGSGEWSELTIGSNMSFVPKEVDKRSADGRMLAFSLTNLTWKIK